MTVLPSDYRLRKFRGDLRASLPLHPLETTLLIVLALHVCSLPWMLGGMRVWAQLISLGFSLLGFVLALVPRTYDHHLAHGDAFRLYPHRKLLRWPTWWIGLVFFGYVLVQAMNPAWEFVQMENSWGMRRVDYLEWLPTGMSTPFEMMNPWRQMIIWLAPFLCLSAIWVGFTRRKSIIALLTLVAANACVLAVVGIVARFTEPGKILWLIKGIPNYCFSSFIYKNHAGSFFALTVGLALSLAVWHHTKANRHLRRSSPSGVFLFGALILLIAVLLSYSRAAILIVGSFLLVFGIMAGVRLIKRSSARQTPLLLAVFCLGFMVFAVIGGNLANSELTLDRIRALTNEEVLDRSVVSRQVVWAAGYEMSREHPNMGWGAGGFRFLFPRYQMSRPEILWMDQKRLRGFMFWEHAHNDYLQFLIEIGRIGVGLLGMALFWALISFSRNRGWENSSAVSLLGACSIVFTHAVVDFPLQSPAILATLFVVAGAALALPGLENRRV